MTDPLPRSRVLIVDDAVENLQILMHALQDKYAVVVARSGREALERAVQAHPDLILLDILMPGMDGFEICAKLKEMPETRDIPVIFLTGLIETENEIRGLALGAVDYIHKPFSIPVIQARVANHLELFQARRGLLERNQALEETARLREEVERITRHDLKNPLNAVIGLPEVLLFDDNLTDEQREILQLIQTSGYSLLEMINSSLDLYKMETGTYVYQPHPVNLIQVVERIVRENQRHIDGSRFRLEMRVDDCPPPPEGFIVPGEELLCYSMLANLLKNAFEASPDHACIEIAMQSSDGAATIAIRNPGVVPPAIRERFFDKYVTSGKSHGTGLGTYSARLIAQTMGGDIELDSGDASTTLRIVLPLTAPSRTADASL